MSEEKKKEASIIEFLKNYVNNIKEGFVPDDVTKNSSELSDIAKGFKGFISRIKNLWKHSIHGKITIILICLFFFDLPSCSSEGECELNGCDRQGQGWNSYSTSQGTQFGLEQIGCVKKYTTGGSCSREHCGKASVQKYK